MINIHNLPKIKDLNDDQLWNLADDMAMSDIHRELQVIGRKFENSVSLTGEERAKIEKAITGRIEKAAY